jgi:uncharacterized protein (DUF1015 family)
MAVVKPFQGFRPRADVALSVSALPYDVMSAEEAREITEKNSFSFLRVTKSEVNLDPKIDSHAKEIYENAAETLEWFIKERILLKDNKPSFYIYRQRMGEHVQVGLVADVSVDEYEQNIIKKHEFTRPDKEQDRVDHILATNAQTGSVFMTYKRDEKIDNIIKAAMKQPSCDFVSDDGVSHTIYVVEGEAEIEAIADAFKNVPAFYIADGHHRSAAAMRTRKILKERNPNHTGKENYNFFQAVLFPHTMVQIMDYNRVVRDLNGYTPDEILEKTKEKFIVEKISSNEIKPKRPHEFSMYLNHAWYRLTAKPETFDSQNTLAALDVNILQNNLLDCVFGIKDQRTDQRINFVGGIRGLGELEKMVDSGKYAIAFALYPTSIEEVIKVSDAGEVMPPKSTWFEPKLRDGVVLKCI